MDAEERAERIVVHCFHEGGAWIACKGCIVKAIAAAEKESFDAGFKRGLAEGKRSAMEPVSQ